MSLFTNLRYLFIPKSNVVGLGRWNTTYKENKKYVDIQHDLSNHDNCYMNNFTLQKRVKQFINNKNKNDYSSADIVMILKSTRLFN